jgi:hypothetical protein
MILDVDNPIRARGRGASGGDVLGAAAEMRDATETVAVATGILNIWMHEPGSTARGVAGLDGVDRFLAEHLAAGADHVCIHVVGQSDEALAVQPWRRLAHALTAL